MLLTDQLAKRVGISEGVLLAAVPVLGTYLAFVFQLGYLWSFGLPPSLIELGLTQIVISIAAIIAAACFYLMVLDRVARLSRLANPILRELGEWLLMLTATAPIVVPVLIVVPPLGKLLLVGIFALSFVSSFIPARQKPGEQLSYVERLREKQDRPREGNEFPVFSTMERTLLLPVMAVALVSVVVFMLGMFSVGLQTSRVVLKSQPNLIYVTKHQDSFVFARYDVSSRLFTGELLFLQSTSERPLELIKKKTGPILPAPTKPASNLSSNALRNRALDAAPL